MFKHFFEMFCLQQSGKKILCLLGKKWREKKNTKKEKKHSLLCQKSLTEVKFLNNISQSNKVVSLSSSHKLKRKMDIKGKTFLCQKSLKFCSKPPRLRIYQEIGGKKERIKNR